MPTTRRYGFVAVALLAMLPTVAALAGPFDVPIDSAQSNLTFQLCVSGTCDDDSSPVAGTVTIELDSIDSPTQIMLHDLHLNLTESVQVVLSWGFLGSLTATANNVALHYAEPGTPLGPEPIVSTQFLFLDAPADPAGTLTYTATGVPCAILQGAGYPCSDTRNLADGGTQTGDVDGTVTSVNRIVTLVSNIDLTTPLDPTNPSLGYFRVYGTVRGSVLVPQTICPGDSNCDDVISWRDIDFFVAAMNDNVAAWAALFAPGTPACDFANNDVNGDGAVSWRDIDALVALMNTVCP